MSTRKSIFAEDWRDCLREHYKYVVQHDTKHTLESLTEVLLGAYPVFYESDLKAFYLEATLRSDALPEDFMPDMAKVLDETPDPQSANEQAIPENPAHPLECQCPSCVTLNLIPHDSDGQPLSPDAREELAERQADQAEDDDSDSAQQMSLF